MKSLLIWFKLLTSKMEIVEILEIIMGNYVCHNTMKVGLERYPRYISTEEMFSSNTESVKLLPLLYSFIVVSSKPQVKPCMLMCVQCAACTRYAYRKSSMDKLHIWQQMIYSQRLHWKWVLVNNIPFLTNYYVFR